MIQFPCSICGQMLSVPDDSAGKKAKCPGCDAVLDIPSEQPAPAADAGSPASDPFGDTTAAGAAMAGAAMPNVGGPGIQNPYAAPSASIPTQPTFAYGDIVPSYFDPMEAVSHAWKLLTENLGLLLGMMIALMAIGFAMNMLGQAIQFALIDATGGQGPAVIIAAILFGFLNQVVQSWILIGFIRSCLAIARNQPVSFSMLFSGGPYLIKYLVVTILLSIAVGFGMLLLIVPGIYLMLTYWPAAVLIIDRQVGIFESFEIAGAVSKGNRLSSLGLGFIGLGLMILGALMCGVGILFTMPLFYMAGVVAYLTMTGQTKQSTVQMA